MVACIKESSITVLNLIRDQDLEGCISLSNAIIGKYSPPLCLSTFA